MTEKKIEGLGPEASFKAYLANGKFMLQKSVSTGEYVFYPRTAVPGDGSEDLIWAEASGKGVVYATTCTRRAPDKGGDYNVALIYLEEGPRMMARVEGVPPDQVQIGMKVEAKIETLKGQPTLIFYPA
ncbi:MAG: OB-fold domain-containing protein [Rhodomicrobium sp.]